ncbi:hypothetical protein DWR03_21440 [Salmonella enterica]|uniref:Uncharacterized protein n=1 Tax=Salmonella enterica TaxID=28901 RepID=A0A402SPX2_SALER|nr:hypothetical protein CS348_07580 [Salmonella enterica subsp. enterica serovar Gaminara]EAA5748438.1 hypothetical protein [Salmonella enterica]EBV5790310.1 hypothetical protein [Salmonella enterica subsp. enterica serovar Rubislaw]ECT9310211.1 hypothetical protein [Salmonella enterica subsp. enterica serovar Montevideo]EAA8780504.1 hypothetical protein [Salmonella enterica]
MCALLKLQHKIKNQLRSILNPFDTKKPIFCMFGKIFKIFDTTLKCFQELSKTFQKNNKKIFFNKLPFVRHWMVFFRLVSFCLFFSEK